MSNRNAIDNDLIRDGAAAIFKSSGRHGVQIFGLSSEQMAMGLVSLLILGVPLAAFLAMLPLWDDLGRLPLVEALNSLIAPTINNLPDKYRVPGLSNFPARRFLIASTTMVELIFITNFFTFFIYNVRQHAIRVWMGYKHLKLFKYTIISGLIFCSMWFFLFTRPNLLMAVVVATHGARLIFYLVFVMPIIAIIFRHLAAVVSFGLMRTVRLRLRKARAPQKPRF